MTTADFDHNERHKAQQSKRKTPLPQRAPRLGRAGALGNARVQSLLRSSSAAGATLDDNLAAAIEAKRGGGQGLDANAQAEIGASLGDDFSDVRVHTDAEADQMNRELQAEAFTTGKDIFFRDGKYDPGSSDGQKLLAHELTHVIQQRDSSSAASQMTVSDPGDASEREASSVADRVGSNGPSVAREGLEEDELAMSAVARQAEVEEEELAMSPIVHRAMIDSVTSSIDETLDSMTPAGGSQSETPAQPAEATPTQDTAGEFQEQTAPTATPEGIDQGGSLQNALGEQQATGGQAETASPAETQSPAAPARPRSLAQNLLQATAGKNLADAKNSLSGDNPSKANLEAALQSLDSAQDAIRSVAGSEEVKSDEYLKLLAATTFNLVTSSKKDIDAHLGATRPTARIVEDLGTSEHHLTNLIDKLP